MNMPSPFTPGPYWFDQEDGSIRSQAGVIIARLVQGGMRPAEYQANARLLAASWKLHALLKRAQEELRMIYDKDCGVIYDTVLRLEMDIVFDAIEARS